MRVWTTISVAVSYSVVVSSATESFEVSARGEQQQQQQRRQQQEQREQEPDRQETRPSSLSDESVSSDNTSSTDSSRESDAIDEELKRWRLNGSFLSHKDGTTEEFWEELHCNEFFAEDSLRPIHNESTWMLLRGVYHAIVGPNQSTLRTPLTHYPKNGFLVDVYVGQSPGIGRGVFAGQHIAEGEPVWSSTGVTAYFSSGEQYRRFLLSIPPDLACDALQWCYCEMVDRDQIKRRLRNETENANDVETGRKSLAIACDLDEGSFVNMGDTEDDSNIGCTVEFREQYLNGQPCAGNLYALRDILAGEQLLVDYGEFAVSEGWESFGL